MTKIILLHYSVPPIVGGVESVLGHHARLMADNGHEVQIVAGRGDQVDARIPFISIPLLDSRHEEVLAVKTDLDAGRVPKGFDPLVERIESQLRGIITNADVVIAHNVCSLNKNLALATALWNLTRRRKHPRLILWHHDLAWTTPRYRAELHDGFPWDLLRTNWKHATQVTISELRQRELAELFGINKDKIIVVPNGVDVAQFLKFEEHTRKYVSQLNLLDAIPLILLPVRITPRKNIELALHVLARLRENFTSANLVVTGPLGPHNPSNIKYFERLKALRDELGLFDSAHFLAEFTTEYIPDAVISDFYRLADALILPSREEGFGIPLIEAAFSHLPVFCADIPPLRELGMDDATFFSPDENPAVLAGLIADYFQSAAPARLALRIRSMFRWEAIYSQHIAPLLEKGSWS